MRSVGGRWRASFRCTQVWGSSDSLGTWFLSTSQLFLQALVVSLSHRMERDGSRILGSNPVRMKNFIFTVKSRVFILWAPEICAKKGASQLWPLFFILRADNVASVTFPKANLKIFFNHKIECRC